MLVILEKMLLLTIYLNQIAVYTLWSVLDFAMYRLQIFLL
jgi:hypothetical protein